MEEDDEFPPQILKLKEENRRLKDRVQNLEEENRNLQDSKRSERLPYVYKDVLENCYGLLVEELEPTHSIDVLIQEKKITLEQAEVIRTCKIRKDKNRCLLNFLIRRSANCFEVFLDSLKDGNKHLWSILTGKIDELLQDERGQSRRLLQAEERTRQLEKENIALKKENGNLKAELQTHEDPRSHSQGDASLAYKDVLKECRILLIEELDPTTPIDVLLQEGEITNEQAAVLNHCGTRRLKIMCLLDMLERKGPDCFEVFLKSLKLSNDRLLTILVKTIITKRVEYVCQAPPLGRFSRNPSLDTHAWYHDNIDRNSAESLLMREEAGTFLVRPKTEKYGYLYTYIISIRMQTNVIHVDIMRVGTDLYLMEGCYFKSVPQIIEDMMINRHKLIRDQEMVRLRRPFQRHGPV